MARLSAAAIIVVVFFAMLYPRSETRAQDGAEATIQAQQTEIAELQTQVANLQEGKPVSTAVSTPSEMSGKVSTYLGGNALPLLPTGKSGTLDVIVVGTYDGNVLPLVIQNNTEKSLTNLSISATARSVDGALIAAGGDQGLQPTHLSSGDYALGYIYFDGIDLPPDAIYEFEVNGDDASSVSYDAQRDLSVQEASFLGDHIVGLFVNDQDTIVQGPMGVYVTCFSEAGEIVGFAQAFTDKDQAEPGETVPFQVDLYGGVDCTNFLVAGNGYSF